MNIVIADDETFSRENLQGMLEKLEFPVKISGMAENGRELVELVERHKPDLVFVDVKMPELNGLEAIKIGKEVSPNTQWVIISGFSDFEYAKNAISLEVVNYLLKPINVKDLKATFNRIVIKNREFSLLLNKEFENELNSIFNDIGAYPDNSGDSVILKSRFYSCVFVFDSFLEEESKSRRIKIFAQTVREKLMEYNSGELRTALLVLPEGLLTLVAAWGFAGDRGARQKVIDLTEQVVDTCASFSEDDFAVTVLQTGICECFDEMQKKLNQLQQLSALRVIGFKQRRMDATGLTKLFGASQANLLKVCEALVSLANAYSANIYMQAMRSIEKLETAVSAFREEWENREALSSIEDFIAYTTNCRIDLSSGGRVWKKQLDELGQALLHRSKKEEFGPDRIIEQVKAIIEKSYMDNISVNQISDMLNVSSSYLSFLFHKKTGETFLRYLTGFRMLKSRELLMDPSLTIQSVSEKVGYYSTRHFTKLFKEYFKEYPSDFKRASAKK